MKIEQLAGNWPRVMVRCTAPGFENDYSLDGTLLVGYFSYIDGKITSLDGDTYSLDDEYECARVINEDDGSKTLVVIYQAKWEV